MGDTDGYGSASTPDCVTDKAVHQPGSGSQDGVWRYRQHRHWERSATGMYPLTIAIQYLRSNTMRLVTLWKHVRVESA